MKLSRVNRDPREEILQKFYNNPAAFAVGLTNLFSNDDGTVQTPYPKQIEYMNLIPKEVKVIVVNKARQIGISTAFQAKVLHGAYFKKAKQYLIISMNEKLAIEVLDKIRSAYLSMPEELQPGFKVDKRDQLVLENGIKITSLTSNPDAPRSYTKAEIIIDEAAFHQDLEKLWAAAIPVTSQGGSLTIVSTPNGIGNVFHKLCTEDIRTLAGDDPKMQKLWYRMSIPIQDCPHQWEKHEQLRATCFTENQWLQEYMCVFLGDQSERAFDKSFMMMNSFKPWEEQRLNQLEDNEFYNNGIYLYRHSGGSDLPIIGSHVHNMEVLSSYESLHAGFDIAMQGKDLSVFTIVGKTKVIQDGETKDCFHVLYSKVWGGELLDNQCEEVMTLCNYFGVKTLCYDKTGGLGQAAEESLKKHNTKVRLIPFVFHSKGAKDSISRSQLFINLKIQIAKKLFLQPFKKEIETHFNDVLYDNQSQRFYTKKHDHDDHPVSQALAFYAGYKKQSNSRLGFVGPTSQRLVLPGDIRESKNINSEFMSWKNKMDKQWER